MKPNFRQEARQALERAKKELERNDAARLRYAALELRLTIEALTYDWAQAFKKELPPKVYKTWQPRKLLKVLLAIYPEADKDNTISIGFSKIHSLGTEVVLGWKAVNRHYDALGWYLHTPNLNQVEEDGISFNQQELRARCAEVVEFIQKVLASPHWNNTLGAFSTINCSRCGKRLGGASRSVKKLWMQNALNAVPDTG